MFHEGLANLPLFRSCADIIMPPLYSHCSHIPEEGIRASPQCKLDAGHGGGHFTDRMGVEIQRNEARSNLGGRFQMLRRKSEAR